MFDEKLFGIENKMFREDSNTAANNNNIIIVVVCIHISTIFTGQIFTGKQFKSRLVWTIIICWNKSCSFSSTSFKVIKPIINQGLHYLTGSSHVNHLSWILNPPCFFTKTFLLFFSLLQSFLTASACNAVLHILCCSYSEFSQIMYENILFFDMMDQIGSNWTKMD